MKTISRSIKVYCYRFGKINVDNNTFYDVQTLETATAMSRKAVSEYCEENGVVLLTKTTEEVRYTLPVDEYIKACRAYVAEHGEIYQTETDETNENN